MKAEKPKMVVEIKEMTLMPDENPDSGKRFEWKPTEYEKLVVEYERLQKALAASEKEIERLSKGQNARYWILYGRDKALSELIVKLEAYFKHYGDVVVAGERWQNFKKKLIEEAISSRVGLGQEEIL